MSTYSTTNAPLPWMEPYMQDYLQRSQDYSNQAYNPSPGTYVDPNSALKASWQATQNRAVNGSPVMGAANDAMTTALRGGFMGNPYMDQQIQNAQGDLVRSWNTVQKPAWDQSMQRSGSFGNTGVMEAAQNGANDLQRNLGRISTDMRSNAYTSGLNFMGQAMGMAPTYANQDYADINALNQSGQQQQQYLNAQQQQNQNWYQEAQNYPAQRLGFMGQALGLNTGGTSTQTAPDPSKMSQLIGGGLTGVALYNALFGGGK